jgi:hypothetical protein
LAEQVTKLSKARRLDAECIVEVKTRIASYPSTALAVWGTLAEASAPAPPATPPNGRNCVSDSSPIRLPKHNKEED